MDLLTFLDLVKDPGKYEAKLQELNSKEEYLTALAGGKDKLDQADKILAEATEKAKKAIEDANRIKSESQATADLLVKRTQEALDEAEKMKGLANEKASEARKRNKALQDWEVILNKKQEELDAAKADVAEQQARAAKLEQELQARITRILSAIQ